MSACNCLTTKSLLGRTSRIIRRMSTIDMAAFFGMVPVFCVRVSYWTVTGSGSLLGGLCRLEFQFGGIKGQLPPLVGQAAKGLIGRQFGFHPRDEGAANKLGGAFAAMHP